MKWTVLTLVILITTSFGEEAGTNTASGDPRESNEFLANYVQIEKTLHTCAVPSKNMFERRTGQDGQPQSSAFDMFCYYQASQNPLSLFLCQYYQLLVENYYGKYCGDPNRLPMDTATQYTQMLQTLSAPCQTLVVTVMQEVDGVNKPVFSSTDDCETVCHRSLFCTNLAYLMSIFQRHMDKLAGNTSGGGGEAPADTGGSPSGDGENNGEIPEGGKDSEVESPPEGAVQGGGGEGEGEREGEGEGGNDIPGEVTDDKKSSEQLGGDKINGGDEGDNDGANIKDGDEYNKLHIPQMDNHEDDSHGLPPPADLSPPQDGVPGGDSGGVLPFDEDNAGTPAEDHQEDEGTEENEEKKEGEDGQLPFDAESLSSESDAGDMESLDESSDDKASKEEFFEDVLENAGELGGQENGDGNEPLLPNAENQQENSKNQNSFKDEMNRLEEEEASSHFLAYSLTAIILIMVTYILYHNKQKIVAIIIEGRNAPNGKRRRYNQNVSEVMPTLKSTKLAV